VRIGIDYTSAVRQGAGIGRLTRNIVAELARIDRGNEYALLVQGRKLPYPPRNLDRRNPASGIGNRNFREVRTWIDERWWHCLWFRLHLPLAIEWAIGPVALFHSPDFTLPPVRGGTRTIVTVHDLSFMRHPECFEPSLLNYLTTQVPRAVARANWILADSASTRHDLISLLDAPAERITVIYPGVEPRFRPVDDSDLLQRVRIRYDLPQRYILSLGTVQPRKNFTGLMEAFARLSVPDLALVIVGGRGWLSDGIYRAAEELGLGARVRFLGFVDDADLPALYSQAEVFALPSLYEGFGIPLLEAMACGTPVIAADNSSLPEVVGQAGILVSARDAGALADAMRQLLAHPERRQELAQRGLARACRFSWRDAAEKLLATYRRVGAL
jgi:glycosyltransferase involved in cell wall biosynthesis